MQIIKKICILLGLTAICFSPLQAETNKNCAHSVEHSIIHLEVLTNAYYQGDLEYEVYLELVEKVDRDVEQELSECRMRDKKRLRFLTNVFGEESSLYDFISNLSSYYQKAREELLNGTERVD